MMKENFNWNYQNDISEQIQESWSSVQSQELIKKERTKGQNIKSDSHDSKKICHVELAKVEVISLLKNVTLFVFTVGDN
jgi:hypothetical protein